MSHDTFVMLGYMVLPPCVFLLVLAGGHFAGRIIFPEKPIKEANATLPSLAQSVVPNLVEDEKLCAEFAVLAWKATKAMRGNQTRVLERSLERMLSRLQECGFNLAEYKGQRIFPGSHVKVLDTADGPEDIVLDDLEPEIVRDQKLIHPALVIIGKGKQS
jgi:hypothetical protein